MDKAEIIRRLEEISSHAVHTVGEEPFVMSLDDGIAIKKAIDLIKHQPEIVHCKECKHAIMTIDGDLCKYCKLETDDDGFLIEAYYDADWYCPAGETRSE